MKDPVRIFDLIDDDGDSMVVKDWGHALAFENTCSSGDFAQVDMTYHEVERLRDTLNGYLTREA